MFGRAIEHFTRTDDDNILYEFEIHDPKTYSEVWGGQVGHADAAAFFGEVVLLALPPVAIPQIGEDFSHLMQGKVVIDISNPRLDREGPITNEWLEMGTGLAMAQYLPGVRLVKALPEHPRKSLSLEEEIDVRFELLCAGLPFQRQLPVTV